MSKHQIPKIVYAVSAYRFGDRESHSYFVGVYSKKTAALNAASLEEQMRGGSKYICEVIEIPINKQPEIGDNYKTIKSIE